MEAARTHPWNLSPSEAVLIQRDLKQLVCTENELGEVKHVAGIDVSVKDGQATAAVVILSFPDLSPVDASLVQSPLEFPYVPGLLAFREGPVILEALRHVHMVPDLLVFDGQGIAHPRRMGIASHIGVLYDLPAIGCAKSRLCGTHSEPEETAGSHTLLYHRDEVIGAVVRTRSGVKPVYVSIGHKVDLGTSIDYVLRCCGGYRLPETTRWAHRCAGGESLPPIA